MRVIIKRWRSIEANSQGGRVPRSDSSFIEDEEECYDMAKNIMESPRIDEQMCTDKLSTKANNVTEETDIDNISTSLKLLNRPSECSISNIEVEEDDYKIYEYQFEHEPVILPKGQMASKLKMAAPYNMFLTTVTASKPTHTEPLSVTIQEILDRSLGEPESSVQISNFVDIDWLLAHYRSAGWGNTPLVLIWGKDKTKNETISQPRPLVTTVDYSSGHHSKMMLLGYKDGSMRVVIPNGCLYEHDWHNATGGVWISDTLPPVKGHDVQCGESVTGFRSDLIAYLSEYKLAALQPWINRIQFTDFSSVRVFLVASIPGDFEPTGGHYSWGHPQLGEILKKYCPPMEESCAITAQCTCLGVFGEKQRGWLYSNFVNSVSNTSNNPRIRYLPDLQVIFPTIQNMLEFHDITAYDTNVPHARRYLEKQTWLKNYMYQWKCNGRYRSEAFPQLKTYFRYSEKGLHWFLHTSASLSKSAWGKWYSYFPTDVLRIRNYEVGVLFLPNYLIGKDVFPIGEANEDGDPPFPIPFDLPLSPYAADDEPRLYYT